MFLTISGRCCKDIWSALRCEALFLYILLICTNCSILIDYFYRFQALDKALNATEEDKKLFNEIKDCLAMETFPIKYKTN